MCTKQFSIIIVALIASAQLSFEISTGKDDYYTAGVVEFRPSSEFSPEARMLNNLEGYLTILNSEDAKNLDIIVFPESTLNNNDQATFVPDPTKDSIVPCEEHSSKYHSLLVQLSCAARNLSIYLVINVSEKEWCSAAAEDTRPCASSGLNLYNTNVVFDRAGAVVSRYRKVHLYGENKNTTFLPERGWFDTDFGVRFGHFICFDILFYDPAQAMVALNGIKDFIFPTMWFSQLPFLTAVQVQQAWSYANDVNLLAAGSSNPLVGSTGTGIYHGRKGVLVAKMNQGIGERKLYAAKVPKNEFHHSRKRSLTASPKSQARPSPSSIRLKRDYLENYETVLLNLSASTELKQKLCFTNSTFCCTFELKWQTPYWGGEGESSVNRYHYRLGVYDDWRNEEATETNQLKNCALFSCKGKNITDCGKLLDTDNDVVFENVTITATFPKAERFLIMPSSLKADIMPLPVNHFAWQETDKKYTREVRYELNTSTANLMAFSIYGNYYDCLVDIVPDEDDNEPGGAALIAYSVGIMGILLIVLSCN